MRQCELMAHSPLSWTTRNGSTRYPSALVHYLLRAAETGGHPLAVLAALRTSHSRSFIESLQRNIAARERTVTVELGLLDAAAGAQLVRQLAPQMDQGTVAKIVQRAGGSPFWLETLTTDPEGSTDSLVESRMIGADADAVFLLSALALAGQPLAMEEVGDLRGWSMRRAQEVATDLVRRGLVREHRGSAAISHDLIREAVASDVPPATARPVHRQLADTFERQANGVDPAASAQLLLRALDHRRLAGQPVLELGLRVARSRGRRLLGSAGLDLLIAIVERAESLDPRARDLKEEVARLASELGQHEVALRWWSVLCDEIEDQVKQAWIALAASEAALHLGRTSDAWAFWRRAESAAALEPAIEVAVTAQAASLELWLEHRPAAAWDAAQRAVQHVRAIGAQSGTAAMLGWQPRRAYLRALLGRDGSGTAGSSSQLEVLVFSDELARAAAGVDERTRLRALADGGLAMRWLGRNTDAEHRLRRAWEESRPPASATGHAGGRRDLREGALFRRTAVRCLRRGGRVSRHWRAAGRVLLGATGQSCRSPAPRALDRFVARRGEWPRRCSWR